MEDDVHHIITIRSLTPRSSAGRGLTTRTFGGRDKRDGRKYTRGGRIGTVRTDEERCVTMGVDERRIRGERANGRLTERRRTQVAFKGSCASGEIVELGWDLGGAMCLCSRARALSDASVVSR